MSETTVEENILTPAEQKARLAACDEIARKNRASLIALKERQLEEQKKHATKPRPRRLEGPKERWYSDSKITYLLLPEVKTWVHPKPPKLRTQIGKVIRRFDPTHS